MRCERSRRLIGLELDGRLDAGDAVRLEAHLAACEGCRDERAVLARTWERLGALPAGPAAAEDWAAIQARLSERRPWLRWPVPVRRGLALAGLAGLAAFGILAGDAMAQAALGPDRQPASVEALAIADGFGLAPFGGPSAGLLLGSGREGGLR